MSMISLQTSLNIEFSLVFLIFILCKKDFYWTLVAIAISNDWLFFLNLPISTFVLIWVFKFISQTDTNFQIKTNVKTKIYCQKQLSELLNFSWIDLTLPELLQVVALGPNIFYFFTF
jgi:hypothetical protein